MVAEKMAGKWAGLYERWVQSLGPICLVLAKG